MGSPLWEGSQLVSVVVYERPSSSLVDVQSPEPASVPQTFHHPVEITRGLHPAPCFKLYFSVESQRIVLEFT